MWREQGAQSRAVLSITRGYTPAVGMDRVIMDLGIKAEVDSWEKQF